MNNTFITMDCIKTTTVFILIISCTWATPSFKKKGGQAVQPVHVQQPTYVEAQPAPQVVYQPVQVQPVHQPPKQVIIQPIQVQPVRRPPPQIVIQPIKVQPVHPPPPVHPQPQPQPIVLKPIIVKPVVSNHPAQQPVYGKPGKHHKFGH